MIAGVELLHRSRKGQFNLGRLRLRGQAAPAIWTSVLSAAAPRNCEVVRPLRKIRARASLPLLDGFRTLYPLL